MRKPDSRAVFALIVLLYLTLAVFTAITKSPWQDEAWFGNPAWNLVQHGFMGTTVLDPASSTWKSVNLTGIDRHTYWVMPMSLLLNGAVMRVFGFGTLSIRLPSVAFGILMLAAWRTILRRLGASGTLTSVALLLIAVDFHFLLQAADGRMDSMAAALGYSALAAYLALRAGSFPRAVLVSHSLAAAAVFTHPNGALPAILLAITALMLDRKRVGVAAVAIAAVPYLVFAAGWGFYIAQAPQDFRAQFLGNAAGRGPTITAPLLSLKMEIVNRYLYNFGIAPWSTWSGRLNAIPLAVFGCGTVLCFAIRDLRTHPAWRILLTWTAVALCYFTWFEGLKTQFYLIYVTPLYAVLCAIAANWIWTQRPAWRVPAVAALLALVVLQGTRTLALAARDPRGRMYRPAVEFLRGRYRPETFIMGDGSLLFGLGPDWRVLDDIRLGYNTGKRPEVIVLDESWTDRIGMLRQLNGPIWEHTQRVLADYIEVYRSPGYRVLERRRQASAFGEQGYDGKRARSLHTGGIG